MFNETFIILKFSNDWNSWNKQFRTEMKHKNLLDQVNRAASYHSMSQKPDIRWFSQDAWTCSISATVEDSTSEELTIADLTFKKQASFQLVYIIYKDKRDQYEKQQDIFD